MNIPGSSFCVLTRVPFHQHNLPKGTKGQKSYISRRSRYKQMDLIPRDPCSPKLRMVTWNLDIPWRFGGRWIPNTPIIICENSNPHPHQRELLDLFKVIWKNFHKSSPKWWWNNVMNPMVESVKSHRKQTNPRTPWTPWAICWPSS